MKTKRQRDKRRYIVERIILTLLVIINLLLITSLIAHEINADSHNRLYTINVPSPRISPNIAICPTPSPTPKSTPSPSPASMNISHKPGYITHSGVNVRQAANIQSDIITTLDMGTRVEIIEDDIVPEIEEIKTRDDKEIKKAIIEESIDLNDIKKKTKNNLWYVLLPIAFAIAFVLVLKKR